MLDSKTVWLIIIGAVGTLTTLFGWSHNTMREKVDGLNEHVRFLPTEDSIRKLINDKLESHNVRLEMIHDRMERIENKIDKLVK